MNITLPDPLQAAEEQKDAQALEASADPSSVSSQVLAQRRSEIEALLIAGLDSGPTVPMTAMDFQDIRREVRERREFPKSMSSSPIIHLRSAFHQESVAMRMLLSLLVLTLMVPMLLADEIENQIKKVREALAAEDFDVAMKAAEKAIEIDPKSPQGYFIRGEVYGAQRKHQEAIEDYNKAYELDKKFLEAINQRGGEQFKLGKIKESIEDFDAFLKEHPKAFDSHWRRGISLYYAGKFEEGAKQFKAGEKVFGDDVENAFWHYLCNARADGVEMARKALLKVGPDARIPMMKVYELIEGKCKAADVIEQAEKAEEKRQSRNEMLFYGHLYVALNYEAEGNEKKCLEHLEAAVKKHKIGHYMWDVGNVHLQLLQKKK